LCGSPYRLRFELGQGPSHLNRFATAFDRARALARRAITSVDIIGVVAAFPDPEAEINADAYGWSKGTSFQHLEAMGVPTANALGSWKGYFWSDDEFDEEVHPWSHRAIQLTWDQADVLLWNQIAHDMGVSPQAPILSKLIDSEREVSVHAYDDRGMDVTATTRDALVGIYQDFGEWLLDHDRERMAVVFGA
jgi:hypothetical protein